MPGPSKPLFETVVDNIVAKIEGEQYQVGSFLPAERDFAEEFGVSRGIVREALRVLEQRGYIKNVPGGRRMLVRLSSSERERDLIYRQLEQAEITDYLDARACLDDLIVGLACERATDEDLRHIEETYNTLRRHYETDQPFNSGNIEAQFHLAIAEATHNAVMENIYRIALDLLSLLRRQSLRSYTNRMEMLREHTNIFEAIRERDALAARLASSIHVRNAKRRYLQSLVKADADGEK